MKAAARAGVLAAVTLWLAPSCNSTLRFDETPGDGGGAGGAELPPDGDVPDVGDLADVTVADVPDTDGSGPETRDGPANIDGPCSDGPGCGWQLDCSPTESETCEVQCGAGRACQDGTCGSGCYADCETNSSCAIATGDTSHVECSTGASCSFTLGNGSNAGCSGGSNCRVQCAGRCTLACQAGATCQLRCGAAADPQLVTGTATCP